MEVIRWKWIFLIGFLLIQDIHSAEIDPDITRFQPGSFFSTIWNFESGQIHYAASEGAKYLNGEAVPSERLVVHYGGHYQLTRELGVDAKEYRGGGFVITPEGSIEIFFKSNGLNSGMMKTSLHFDFLEAVQWKVQASSTSYAFTKSRRCEVLSVSLLP